jgi:hypothetical protein
VLEEACQIVASKVTACSWNERNKQMKHKFTRITLVVFEAIVALSAIAGGVSLATGTITFPLAWLQGTPFSDYTIPGLVLAIVVGGSALLAAATVFIRREWAVLVSVAAGLLMVGYEVVRVAMIDHLDWFYALYFVLGLSIFGLAAYLWIAEYRRQHFPTRQGSPA